jgi:phosphodiesterase/alkaline phosphatase D-like protein
MSKNKHVRAVIFLIVMLNLTLTTPTSATSTASGEIPDSHQTEEIKVIQGNQQAVNNTSEVIQHTAFAHLDVSSGIATISAMFSHPEGLNEEVRIRWLLYGWNEGSITKDELHPVDNQVTGVQQVVLDEDITVPEYDYYWLECRNQILNESSEFEQFTTTESRYSLVAPYNGIWERTGEVTSDRAVLHTYLTEKPASDPTDADTLRVPPMAGSVQFVVYRDESLNNKVSESGFFPVDDYINRNGEWLRTNYNFRWTVTGLEPDNKYYYQVVTQSSDGANSRTSANVNSFKTAPTEDDTNDVEFVVVSCLDPIHTAYSDPDEGAMKGLKVFDSMLNYPPHEPDFIIMTGDTVYYDGYNPNVGNYSKSDFIKRWLYWYAYYQFDNLRAFFQKVPGFWMVDDHDYWENNTSDIHPDGWHIFRNTNPTPGLYASVGEDAGAYYQDNPFGTSQGDGTKFWRTIRWGKHLELFIEEGRHHRETDANKIWGDEQRAWLEERIKESDATFKILVAGTPLIGPVPPDDFDPTFIPDKHVNDKYRAETELFLNNIKDVPNFYIIAGDRHYKYHGAINSANFPQLSHIHEFGSGAAAGPPHAVGGGGIKDSDLAIRIFQDGLEGTGASAGYLRVEISEDSISTKIKFSLIQVTEEISNREIHSATFEIKHTQMQYLPVIISSN